ncbi:Sec-independent protein translocase subunit TatA [Corynebacterium simulans]|uniref:Sec-independent protein translocase protein TatA n=1 Tax=Corynebacterium accolens TaxID=38284 RepID=A0A2A4ALK0_9CORY|nr:Sec-independent protein translocase subunit TatA [Corynebacterium simulans]MCK6159686.1 Sec-independent protein translocase subunit TatA [Corynebacterium simulans]PCC83803.1 twin-arginine translocase TatA/TatE family subunit [Corynebacterium accolens]
MSLGPWEILAILLVVLLLFGATKLPELARSMGRSMRIFKSEVNEMHQENQPKQEPNQISAAKQSDEEFWNGTSSQPGQAQPNGGNVN